MCWASWPQVFSSTLLSTLPIYWSPASNFKGLAFQYQCYHVMMNYIHQTLLSHVRGSGNKTRMQLIQKMSISRSSCLILEITKFRCYKAKTEKWKRQLLPGIKPRTSACVSTALPLSYDNHKPSHSSQQMNNNSQFSQMQCLWRFATAWGYILVNA